MTAKMIEAEREMLGPVLADLEAEWKDDCEGTDVTFEEWLAYVTKLAGVAAA